MEKVNNGIVFSNDIFRILKGQNALDFDYCKNGLIIPNESQISTLREDFKKDVNKIFKGNVTIFSENEMEDFLDSSIDDCQNCPHCCTR